MAVSMGVQIMSVQWILMCWERRDDPMALAIDETLVNALPFLRHSCAGFLNYV